MSEIIKTLNELYRIFDILNKDYFNSDLEQPIITIQKRKANNLGHFTLSKIWKNKDTEDAKYEININPINLDRPINEIICTLQHEMVHYWNKINDIRDANNNVHNKKFKVKAEECGLIVTKSKQYGWGHTECSEAFIEYIESNIEPNESAFEYYMNLKVEDDGEPKKVRAKKTFKYNCPTCGLEVKAKIDSHIKCVDCNEEMEMEDMD